MGAPVSQDGKWSVGATATSSVIWTRPADSTQYTAGDVMAATSTANVAQMFVFPAARSNGGGGIIQSAILIDSVAAATKPDSILYLFDSLITMQSDNAAWAPTTAQLQTCIGKIAFPVGSFIVAQSGTNGLISQTGLGQAFTCLPDRSVLYGILVAQNAYTPASGEQFEIRLQILQD